MPRAHDSRRISAAPLIAAIVMLFAAVSGRGAAATLPDETLLLSVVVNNYSTGKIGEFMVRNGDLFARPEDLHELGFRVPLSTRVTNDRLVALSDLPAFRYRIDQASQTLYVTAGNERLLPTLLATGSSTTDKYQVESGIGATLDYDAIGRLAGGDMAGSGLFDLRAFSPWGVASSGLLVSPRTESVHGGGYSAIRLDSTYAYSDPDTLRRYRLGDFITGFLPWTRPVRLGGVQVNSDFSMRPDLITFPVPALSGSVAVPSTVDVLVDGSRVVSRDIQPGPFQVPQLPVITGAGTVSMTVTNALGQQVTTELPFYASGELLAPGLQTYSIEAGAVRRNWGVISNDYGSLAGAITYRRGLSSVLTIEGHAEASRGLFMGGLGGVLNIGNFAVGNLSIAGSTGDDHNGGQIAVGIQHLDRRFSIGGSAIIASRNFGDIATVNGDPSPQLQLNANAGLSFGRYGSLGVAYTAIERRAQPVAPPGVLLEQPAQRSHIVSASYSVEVGPAFLYATAFEDLARSRDRGAMIQLTIPLGPRTSGTVSAQSESGLQSGRVQVTQNVSDVGDWGYNVFAEQNGVRHEFAQVSYKSPWALVTAGVDRFNRQTTAQAEVQGALSFIDDALFATNRINDSFAVVDTDGVGGIRVQEENRYAGTTDSAGKAILPDLRSFDVNHVSIDARDAPADVTVPFTDRYVRPQDRSGVVVKFKLKTNHGALLRLVDEAGAPVPVNSAATLRSTGAAGPVGYDGEAFVVDLQAHNEVDVEWPNGHRCVVHFDYQPAAGQIPIIGPLPCRAAQQ